MKNSVNETEKNGKPATNTLLYSILTKDPLSSTDLPKELKEAASKFREYKIAENIVAPDSDAQEMPTIDDLCNALEKQGKKNLSEKIRRAQHQ